MTIPVTNHWQPILDQASDRDTYQRLRSFLKEEYQTTTVYPPMDDLWTAFEATDFDQVKVVILGQDPYHGPGQSHGLAFSVRPGIKIPPSLRNIYKELESDLGIKAPDHGYLMDWAKSGVLLLNTVLTVRAGQAHSHRKKGWEEFTNEVIQELNKRDRPMVFILWGKAASSKKNMIDTNKHGVIESPHPSPLSAHRGFFGSRPFSKANAFLKDRGQEPVDWHLSPVNLD